jgi:hypothetical protein
MSEKRIFLDLGAPLKPGTSLWQQILRLHRGLRSETLHPPPERDQLYDAARKQRLGLFAELSRNFIKICCRKTRQHFFSSLAEKHQTCPRPRWQRRLSELDRLLGYLRKLWFRLSDRERQRWTRIFCPGVIEEMLKTGDGLEQALTIAKRGHDVCYEWFLRMAAWLEFSASHMSSHGNDRSCLALYMKATAWCPCDGRAYFAIGCVLLVGNSLQGDLDNSECMNSHWTAMERLHLARAYWYMRACLAERHPRADARKRLVGLTRHSRFLASVFFEHQPPDEHGFTLHQDASIMEMPKPSSTLGMSRISARHNQASSNTDLMPMKSACPAYADHDPFEQVLQWMDPVDDIARGIAHDALVIHLITLVVFLHADAESARPLWQLLRCCCLRRLDAGISILVDYIAAHSDVLCQSPADALAFMETCKTQWIQGLTSSATTANHHSVRRLDPITVAAVDDFCDALENKQSIGLQDVQKSTAKMSGKLRHRRAALPEERLFQGFQPLMAIYADRIDFTAEHRLAQDAAQALSHTSFSAEDSEAVFAEALRFRKLESLVSRVRRRIKKSWFPSSIDYPGVADPGKTSP